MSKVAVDIESTPVSISGHMKMLLTRVAHKLPGGARTFIDEYTGQDVQATLKFLEGLFDKPPTNPILESYLRLEAKEMREVFGIYAKNKLGHQPRNRHERRKLASMQRRER